MGTKEKGLKGPKGRKGGGGNLTDWTDRTDLETCRSGLVGRSGTCPQRGRGVGEVQFHKEARDGV
jgi:hypothetical protein